MSQDPYHPYPPHVAIAPRPVNGLGIAGFIVSLVGFFTGCILCPVGLLLSFIALFKRPRGFAVAGFILGMIGTVIPVLVVGFFGLMIFGAISAGKPGVQSFFSVVNAQQDVIKAAEANGYVLPEDASGNIAILRKQDGWGRPLRYHKLSESRYEIRSAGQDGVFDTSDDIELNFDEPFTSRPSSTTRPRPTSPGPE
jgi:hypothetical protein